MSNLNSLLSDPITKRFFTYLLIFFVILSLLLGAFWYGYGVMDKELKVQEEPRVQKLNLLHSQVKFLEQQVRLYEKYGEKYQVLVKKGLVKKQDRVLWTDSLLALKKQYLIPDLQFSFSAEKPLRHSQFSSIKVLKGMFFYSQIKLSMSLQHEEDLLRIFNTINLKISPLYLVEGCKISIHNRGYNVSSHFNLLKGNLKANCSLIVFNTHLKDTKK